MQNGYWRVSDGGRSTVEIRTSIDHNGPRDFANGQGSNMVTDYLEPDHDVLVIHQSKRERLHSWRSQPAGSLL